MNEWQPIETAPKGVKVLVTRYPAVGRPPINIATFSEANLKRHEKPWKISAFAKLRYHPTHWMPLPEPPESAA